MKEVQLLVLIFDIFEKRRFIPIHKYQNRKNQSLYSQHPTHPPSVDVLQKMAQVVEG